MQPTYLRNKEVLERVCSLAITEAIAVKHSQGDKSYSKHDAVRDIVKKMTNKPEEEYALERTCSTQLENPREETL